MPDYSQGKVYRILQDNEKTVDIGSTTQPLSGRMAQHRKGIIAYPDRKLYKLMGDIGVDHFRIELIADVCCERGEQLRAEEGRLIRLHKTAEEGANHNMAGRSRSETQKAYKETHPEIVKTLEAAYKTAHKDELKARYNAYDEAHREERKVYARVYYLRKKAERAVQAQAVAANPPD